MRPMILGPEQQADLARVRAYAEAHPLPLLQLLESMRTGKQCTDSPGFRCEIPVGYRVAFTIEHHPKGQARHLSVSLAKASPGILPNAAAIQMIGQELGMRMDIFDAGDTTTYFEGVEGQPPRAVSIIEPFEPEPATEPVEAMSGQGGWG